jgi:predicted nuclease of predicted toxin-antitoxin system
MPMSSLIPNLRFLLDENVRRDLYRFLISQNFDVKLVSNATSDSKIAQISKLEERILVTNDEDFCDYSETKIFSVIWLRIPQNDSKALIVSFEKVLNECSEFKGRLLILKVNSWQNFPLPIFVSK